MAWYWLVLIGIVIGCIGGYALVAYAIGRGHNFGKGVPYPDGEWWSDWWPKRKGIVPKGLGMYLPLWSYVVFIAIYPFLWISEKLRKGEKDPHDISGEV